MLCNIKPVPFHESDKHIFAKIPGGVRTPGAPPPSGSAYVDKILKSTVRMYLKILKSSSIDIENTYIVLLYIKNISWGWENW